MKLAGKVAVVTGGGGEIGRAIALTLAKEGAGVVVNFREDAKRAEAVTRMLSDHGAEAKAIQADVSVRAQVNHLLSATLDAFGRVDILVNNAGVSLSAELFSITDEMWDEVLSVNLKGTFLCSQVIGQHMWQGQGGRIVNIASTAGISPLPRSHHYVASKAGVIGLTRSLALSLSPSVTVNAVAPGFVETDSHRDMDSARRGALLDRIPLGRLASIQEVADTVRFLVCEGGYITGQTLVVDGGFCLAT